MVNAASAAHLFREYGVSKTLFSVNMFFRQDIVFSLILDPIKSGLRGFCLTPLISPLGKGG
jgi:hypothetical protein